MTGKNTFHWLVTGGAGFIGAHLVKELIRRGQRVSVLDNLSGRSSENLASVRSNIHFVEGDICKEADIRQACAGVDYVLHEAAVSSVAVSMSHPQETDEINVQGTLRVLEAARQSGVRRGVFASSAAIYGNSPHIPYNENTPANCQSPYAWSKLAAEQLCHLYTNAYGLPTVILRYFNVFGPGQNPQAVGASVTAKFMQLAAEKKPIELDWDGQQRRDFVHVNDVVQANLLAAQKGVAGEIYNVASGKTYTILELVDMIEKITGYTFTRQVRPKRAGDLHDSAANISKISTLGFVPSGSLEQGLREMWAEKTAKTSN